MRFKNEGGDARPLRTPPNSLTLRRSVWSRSVWSLGLMGWVVGVMGCVSGCRFQGSRERLGAV